MHALIVNAVLGRGPSWAFWQGVVDGRCHGVKVEGHGGRSNKLQGAEESCKCPFFEALTPLIQLPAVFSFLLLRKEPSWVSVRAPAPTSTVCRSTHAPAPSLTKNTCAFLALWLLFDEQNSCSPHFVPQRYSDTLLHP